MNESAEKSTVSEWAGYLVRIAAVLFPVLLAVGSGAWYMSTVESNVEANSAAIREVADSVKSISLSVQQLVRVDERLETVERGLLKVELQASRVELEQAKRDGYPARLDKIEDELRGLKDSGRK